MPNNSKQNHCINILDALYKCNTKQDNYTNNKCKKLEKLITKANVTYTELYLKCVIIQKKI